MKIKIISELRAIIEREGFDVFSDPCNENVFDIDDEVLENILDHFGEMEVDMVQNDKSGEEFEKVCAVVTVVSLAI